MPNFQTARPPVAGDCCLRMIEWCGFQLVQWLGALALRSLSCNVADREASYPT